MRKILIPTDFSDNAMNAIKYALECFKYEICEFYFMHAYLDEIYANGALLSNESLGEVTREVSKASETKLNEILNIVNEISPNPKFTYKIVSSNNLLVDETDKIVEEQNIDLIVMGTLGSSEEKKITFGSHTLQVIKYVRCPVLVIPAKCSYTQPKHILFPTNYMIPYSRRELKLLCELGAPYRAKIDVLYVSSTHKLSVRQENNKNFMKDGLCKNELSFVFANNKNITNAIYTYIKEHNINMLVMVNTWHSFLETILYQSKIDEMSLHLDIPFFVLQNLKRY